MRMFGNYAIRIVVWSILYWSYFHFLGEQVPENESTVINGFLIPLIFGCLGYLSFAGNGAVRFFSVAVASIVVLSISFHGDPAKPGIEKIFIAVMTAVSCAGAALTGGAIEAIRALRRKSTRRAR